MNQCSRCSADFSTFPPMVSASGSSICASCGASLNLSFESTPIARSVESSSDWLSDFFLKLKEITLSPTAYFKKNGASIASEGGLSSALAFAVLVQWIGSFFNFMWRALTGAYFEERVSGFFPPGMGGVDEIRQKAVEFLFGAGSILVAPFSSLAKLLLTGLFVHAAVRFFVREPSDRPLRYSTTLKILALSSAPWILCFIPGLGAVLAWILTFTAAFAGIREVYHTTSLRATIAVLFPELLFLSILFALLLSFLFLAFGTLRLLF